MKRIDSRRLWDDDSATTPLPWWRRLVFATVVPNLVVGLAVSMYLNRTLPSPKFGRAGVAGLLLLAFAGMIAFWAFLVPIVLCTLRAAFRPWKRWYTALGGGFAAVGLGLTMGCAVILTLRLLTG